MSKTSIEWTELSWNPVTGCTKISPGCSNCYAERIAIRLQAMGQPNYKNGFKLSLHDNIIKLPLSWKKPSMIFVNSMGDLFHEDVPIDFIKKTIDIMKQASWHRFQILTKRSQRLLEINHLIDWPNNVWMGVSIENNDYVFRLEHLRKTNAKIKFISFEPLIGPISKLDTNGIHWVIVGGESGPRARPIRENWVINIQEQCAATGVPFFFKQWGGKNKKRNGRILRGRTWDELPAINSLF